MKRRVSMMMCIVLMMCLFTAASGSVFAAGKDISVPAGSEVAMAVNLDYSGEISGVDVVDGELPDGLGLSVEEGRVFLSGTAAAAGDRRAVIRLQPWDARSEFALRIRVRAADNTTAETAAEETAQTTGTETADEQTPAVPGPNITKHPGGETVSELGSAIFVARADGATEIEWYLVAPRGVSYKAEQVGELFPRMAVAGQGTQTLTLYTIPADFNGWQVEAHFKNSVGAESISQRAAVTVSATLPAAPAITRAPESEKIQLGTKLTLAVYAEAPTGNSIKYQWFQTTENDPATALAIPEATGPEYVVPETEGTVYYCVGLRSVNNETVSTTAYTPLAEITYSKDPPVPAHVHEFGEEWQQDDIYHWHVCTGCGEIQDKATHTYSWTETVKPTSRKQGERVGECTVCGYSTTQVIPAQRSEDSGKPGVGLIIAMLVLVIALLVMGVMNYKRNAAARNRRQNPPSTGGRHSGTQNRQ